MRSAAPTYAEAPGPRVALDTMASRDIVWGDIMMAAKTYAAEPQAPLTPAMFHILLALAAEDLHGYAILKEVALRTRGEVRLSTGTLYGIIKRLLTEGLIVERRERPAASNDDERRRYYRLTARGREVAAAEAERLEKVVALARARHLLSNTQPA
jgi:DNA-binding PadR family transcriptional regulator